MEPLESGSAPINVVGSTFSTGWYFVGNWVNTGIEAAPTDSLVAQTR